jgi:hypothetical protein
MKLKYIAITGIVITICGWFIDHGDQIKWVTNIFASEYVQTLNAYEKILGDRSSIQQGNTGFVQLAAIISERVIT